MLAEFVIYVAAVVIGSCIIRIQFYRPVEIGNSFIVLAAFIICKAASVIKKSDALILIDCFGIILNGFSEIVGIICPVALSVIVPCREPTCFFTLVLVCLDFVNDLLLSGIVRIQLIQALIVAFQPFNKHIFKEFFNHLRMHLIWEKRFAEIIHH